MPRARVTHSLEVVERSCPRCGMAMWVVHIEHSLDRDRRTYECPKCEHRVTFYTKH